MKLFAKSSRILRLWYYLAGSRVEFSMENRAFNIISVITFLLLSVVLCLNIIVSLPGVRNTILTLLILQVILYYYSRYRKRFHISIILYAIISYLALIIIYMQNGGINGPIIFCFFISLHLLIALTPNKQHIIWVLLHILIPSALVTIEYIYPSFIPNTYPSRYSRFFDIDTTYIMAVLLTYSITLYLRNSYTHEKKIAEIRAGMIGEQTQKLADIAWMQSHMVRNHATTILGLAQLFNNDDPHDPINKEIIDKIQEAAGNLDHSIREVDAKTKSMRF